jgi:hypothetical protein
VTSEKHNSGRRGPQAYDINSRVVLGSLDAGIGHTHLSTILSTMNVPSINHTTFKTREREVGRAVEDLARGSCKENIEKEKNHYLKLLGHKHNENDLIDINVSYDMGWQKRGKGHNSNTGHGAAMGLVTGKVLAYSTRCKTCRVCEAAKKDGKEPRSHDCRANHEGSSKMMEPSVACELFTNSVNDGKVKYSTYVGDDDSTTLLHLSNNVPYGINKWSDQYHTKRSLSSRLYNLKERKKFPGATPLSSKVINYLAKCFSYCISQNKKNPKGLQKGFRSIVPHAFGDHHLCNPSWCRALTNVTYYRHAWGLTIWQRYVWGVTKGCTH